MRTSFQGQLDMMTCKLLLNVNIIEGLWANLDHVNELW